MDKWKTNDDFNVSPDKQKEYIMEKEREDISSVERLFKSAWFLFCNKPVK